MNGRPWTAREKRHAVAMHGKATTVAIAAALDRSLSSTYQIFFKLGLTKPRWSKSERRALKRYIRAQYDREWSDTEIAVGWSKKHPERTVDRGWISEVRREQLKLQSRGPYSKRYRRRVARTTKEQLRTAGLPSIGHLRKKAFEDFAVRQGWPGVNRPRLVQILNLLYERGPHTREAIAKAIGVRWAGTPNGKHPASRHSMYCNAPGGSATAVLIRIGLVVKLGRNVKTGPGRGQRVCLYAIAPGVKRGKVLPAPVRDKYGKRVG